MSLREIATRPGDLTEPSPPPSPPTVEQFQGALLGCTLGDVLGAWAERQPASEARDFAVTLGEFDFKGIGKHHHGMEFGQYTDDTQLSRELVLSLIDEGKWVPEGFADRIANIFARDGIVGYGGATLMAATRLMDGVPWDEAGTPPPRAGNGGAMRAAPIGLFFWMDAEGLAVAAQEQARITHTAPLSISASVAIAMATAMCLNSSKTTSGPHELGWWSWLVHFIKKTEIQESELDIPGAIVKKDPVFSDDLMRMAHMVFRGRKRGRKPGCEEEQDEALAIVLEGDDTSWEGVSPWARSSALWSLYCLMAYPEDLWAALCLSIAVGGDSDTIAAMTGAMVGAHVGVDKFPKAALEEVAPLVHDTKTDMWDWNALSDLASTLHTNVMKTWEVHNEEYKTAHAAWKKAKEEEENS